MIPSISLSTLPQFIKIGLGWKIEQESLMFLLAFPLRYLKTRKKTEKSEQQGDSSLTNGGNSGIIICVGRCEPYVIS